MAGPLLEAVITSVGYGDFLEATLPHNIQYFDHCVVVTSHDDKATQEICRKYTVPCVKTSAFTEFGDEFNKARGINLGLGHLRGLGWILHLDADIYLPHRFKDLLYRAQLSPENIYGADRCNVYGWQLWEDHKHKLLPHYSGRYFVKPPTDVFPMGDRIIHEDLGFLPIGFFELFHKNTGHKYPINQGTAEHTDVLFAAQWPRKNRILLPEVVVYHLESESGPVAMGKNWKGRTTRRFECPNCREVYCQCHRPHHHHHHHPYKPHHHHPR